MPRRAARTERASSHRAGPPCHHAERSESHPQRGRGPSLVRIEHDTRQRASTASIIGACLRRLQVAERHGAKQRASGAVRWRLRREVKWSELKRTESGWSAVAVCRRLVRGAGAALCGVSRRRGGPRRQTLCQRSESGVGRRARAAVPLPVSRLRRAGNAVKRTRSLRSGSRSGVDVPAHVVESGPPRQAVPRWCAQRTLAGLGWRSNPLCPLRRLAGLTPRGRLCLPWAKLKEQAADSMPPASAQREFPAEPRKGRGCDADSALKTFERASRVNCNRTVRASRRVESRAL